MSSETNEPMSINEILADFTRRAKIGGGIEGIAWINVSRGNIEHSFPEKSKLPSDIKSLLIATAKSISMFDEYSSSQTIDSKSKTQKSEFVTENQRIVSLIVSTKTNDNYALCVVANINGASTDFITNVFENVHQKNIENVINAMYSQTIN